METALIPKDARKPSSCFDCCCCIPFLWLGEFVRKTASILFNRKGLIMLAWNYFNTVSSASMSRCRITDPNLYVLKLPPLANTTTSACEMQSNRVASNATINHLCGFVKDVTASDHLPNPPSMHDVYSKKCGYAATALFWGGFMSAAAIAVIIIGLSFWFHRRIPAGHVAHWIFLDVSLEDRWFKNVRGMFVTMRFGLAACFFIIAESWYDVYNNAPGASSPSTAMLTGSFLFSVVCFSLETISYANYDGPLDLGTLMNNVCASCQGLSTNEACTCKGPIRVVDLAPSFNVALSWGACTKNSADFVVQLIQVLANEKLPDIRRDCLDTKIKPHEEYTPDKDKKKDKLLKILKGHKVTHLHPDWFYWYDDQEWDLLKTITRPNLKRKVEGGAETGPSMLCERPRTNVLVSAYVAQMRFVAKIEAVPVPPQVACLLKAKVVILSGRYEGMHGTICKVHPTEDDGYWYDVAVDTAIDADEYQFSCLENDKGVKRGPDWEYGPEDGWDGNHGFAGAMVSFEQERDGISQQMTAKEDMDGIMVIWNGEGDWCYYRNGYGGYYDVRADSDEEELAGRDAFTNRGTFIGTVKDKISGKPKTWKLNDIETLCDHDSLRVPLVVDASNHKTCPQQHPLEKISTFPTHYRRSGRWGCDLCKKEIPKDGFGVVLHCEKCKYDVCSSCHGRPTNSSQSPHARRHAQSVVSPKTSMDGRTRKTIHDDDEL